MNKNIQHTNANDGISLDGVRALVNGLPWLEYISFGSIGRVLDCSAAVEDSAPLKLTYFSEQESNKSQVVEAAGGLPSRAISS